MRILGIDPGSVITGFGVVEQHQERQLYVASGCIRVGTKIISERLKRIFEDLSQVIETYRPAIVAIERVFVYKNVSSALKLGQARGAALVACATQQLEVFEYAPREIKKAVVGYGHADKIQMQKMVQELLQLNAAPQADAADALAIAMCHAQQDRIQKRLL